MGFFNLSTSTVTPSTKTEKKNRSFFTSFMDTSPQLHHHEHRRKSNPKAVAQKCVKEEYLSSAVGDIKSSSEPTNDLNNNNNNTSLQASGSTQHVPPSTHDTPHQKIAMERSYNLSSLESYTFGSKKKKKTFSMSYMKCCPFDDVSALIDVDKFEKKGGPSTSAKNNQSGQPTTTRTVSSTLAANPMGGQPAMVVTEQPQTQKAEVPSHDKVLFSSSILLSRPNEENPQQQESSGASSNVDAKGNTMETE
ncbi:hypothetical protein FDP41_006759 [Naegleria fowleri]|uniref:Uncharacterized protein n=1 Tax=Naegleria fowleri TaxID=5763 RepID=A0A6A5BML8_NAEFO|nr:uncharacterized protein FDP41_006759 [Naegleria fowleri]KAF0974149.1 hypothetical protein FDP41_006759 [Naegleria fowleri]CAG4711360.1 unnamed protein product [Naegleria fowleri]